MVNQSLFGLIIPHQILQFNNSLDFGGLQAHPTFYILLHNQDIIYYTTKLSIDISTAGNYNAKSLIFSSRYGNSICHSRPTLCAG